MPVVFIANPTLQHRDFHYRVPGMQTARVLRIRAGGQERLPESLAGNDLAFVLAQLENIGAVPRSEVHAIAAPKALIFEVAPNPIKVDAIEEGLEKDEEARQDVAGAKMEEAGLAAYERAQANGARVAETSFEVFETSDRGKVKDSVDFEVVVSTKPSRRAGSKRTETKV